MPPPRLSRENYLQVASLPDWETFELRPDRHPHDGRWMIRVSAEGHLDRLVEPGGAAHYLEMVRETDPDLAAQVDACLEELKRCRENQE